MYFSRRYEIYPGSEVPRAYPTQPGEYIMYSFYGGDTWESAAKLLTDCGFSPEIRPDKLTVADYTALVQAIADNKMKIKG